MNATTVDRIRSKAAAKVRADAQPKHAKAQAAGARSTHATPLTYEQRADRYVQQTGRLLTPRQMRRIAKKINGSFHDRTDYDRTWIATR